MSNLCRTNAFHSIRRQNLFDYFGNRRAVPQTKENGGGESFGFRRTGAQNNKNNGGAPATAPASGRTGGQSSTLTSSQPAPGRASASSQIPSSTNPRMSPVLGKIRGRPRPKLGSAMIPTEDFETSKNKRKPASKIFSGNNYKRSAESNDSLPDTPPVEKPAWTSQSMSRCTPSLPREYGSRPESGRLVFSWSDEAEEEFKKRDEAAGPSSAVGSSEKLPASPKFSRKGKKFLCCPEEKALERKKLIEMWAERDKYKEMWTRRKALRSKE